MAAQPGSPFYNPRPDMQTAFNQGTAQAPPAGAQVAKTYDEIMSLDPNADPKRVGAQAATNYLRATYGLKPSLRVNDEGKIVDAHGFLARNLWWIGPASIFAAGAVGALSQAGSPTMVGTAVGETNTIGGVAADGLLPATFGTGAGVSVPAAIEGAGGVTAARQVAQSATGAKGIAGQVVDWAKDPKNLVGLAATIPTAVNALKSPGNSPFGNAALEAQVNEALSMQTARYKQMQPAVDSLVNQAYGMTPIRYRSAQAPATFTPNQPAAPGTAYAYQSPRFGG
ncbi:MAG: hypothetical protein ABL982_00070 [Vicinamibacterales bacterium]